MSSRKQTTNDRADPHNSLNLVHINIFVCNVSGSLAMLTIGNVVEMQVLSGA
ncbi:hypothetical protein SAMN03159423_5177 [Bradyrhizobium sp. NFR13]|jgi:hypothetical protein|nr:hypothetical protein SAMN03159423_5177 [Bradyrhizobium sp. NFR13]